MKKLTEIFFISFMIGLLSACGASDVGDGVAGESCLDTYACYADNSTMQTCCSPSSCRYVTGTRTFNCNGLNCDTAAQEVASFCTGYYGKAETDLLSKLLIEKADNIVLKKSIDEMYIDLGNEVSQ